MFKIQFRPQRKIYFVSLNAVREIIDVLFFSPRIIGKHINMYMIWTKFSFIMLMQVIRIETVCFKGVKSRTIFSISFLFNRFMFSRI
jgi:hypothetical protein